MNSRPVRLLVGTDVRATLMALLNAALELSEGSRVVDHLPINPWGDVEAFRREVYLPVHGQEPSRQVTPDERAVVLEPQEVGPMQDVLDALAASITEGIPWPGLTESERDVVARLASQLGSGE